MDLKWSVWIWFTKDEKIFLIDNNSMSFGASIRRSYPQARLIESDQQKA